MPVLRLLIIVLVVLNLLTLAAGQGWLGTSQPRGEPERVTNQLNPERIVIIPAEGVTPRPADAMPRREPVAPLATTDPGQAAAESVPAQESPAEAPVEAPAEAPVEAPVAHATPDEAILESAPAGTPVQDICIAYDELTQQQADTLEQLAADERGEVHVEHSQDRTPSGWWVRLPPAASREVAGRKVSELRALGVNDFYVIQERGANQFAISLGLFKTEAAAQQHLTFLQGKRVRGAGVAPRHSIVHRVELRGPPAILETLADELATRVPAALRVECPN